MKGSTRSALPAELAIGASIKLTAAANAVGRHRSLTASRLLISTLPPHHGRPNAAQSAGGSDLAQSTVAPLALRLLRPACGSLPPGHPKRDYSPPSPCRQSYVRGAMLSGHGE